MRDTRRKTNVLPEGMIVSTRCKEILLWMTSESVKNVIVMTLNEKFRNRIVMQCESVDLAVTSADNAIAIVCRHTAHTDI